MSKKVCCIFNYAPHYRFPIYSLMDKELCCDFYFGDREKGAIKKLDYSALKGFKKEVKNTWILNTTFIWQYGVWHLIFKKYKYYIITGQPNILSDWVLMILGKILGKKVMVWSHGMKSNPDNKAHWFEINFYRLCHKALLYGNHSRNIMIRRGFKPEKLVCIYNSLDNAKHLQLRKKLTESEILKNHFKNSDPVIVYVGRIQHSKKLEVLVDLVERLNENNKPCNLLFIGKDLKDNRVKEKAKETSISERIWFYGPCYDEALLGSLIYNSNVCISPGPIGLTAIHVLSFGTPAISNDNFYEQMPEHEVIQEGVTGSFFIEDSLQDLYEKTLPWLDVNPEQRTQIRKNCYRVIDERWNPNYQLEVLKMVTKSNS